MAQTLILIGASIIGLLGAVHLLYTFLTNKFDAREAGVTAAMKSTAPVISGQTTVWRAWIGFNASHSIGALLVAAVFIPLAAGHYPLIQESAWFRWLPLVVALAYLWLAKRYWFYIPLIGVSIASLCFLLAALLG